MITISALAISALFAQGEHHDTQKHRKVIIKKDDVIAKKKNMDFHKEISVEIDSDNLHEILNNHQRPAMTKGKMMVVTIDSNGEKTVQEFDLSDQEGGFSFEAHDMDMMHDLIERLNVDIEALHGDVYENMMHGDWGRNYEGSGCEESRGGCENQRRGCDEGRGSRSTFSGKGRGGMWMMDMGRHGEHGEYGGRMQRGRGHGNMWMMDMGRHGGRMEIPMPMRFQGFNEECEGPSDCEEEYSDCEEPSDCEEGFEFVEADEYHHNYSPQDNFDHRLNELEDRLNSIEDMLHELLERR